jgi:hypothetical protein
MTEYWSRGVRFGFCFGYRFSWPGVTLVFRLFRRSAL